jgi:hypothetical protein
MFAPGLVSTTWNIKVMMEWGDLPRASHMRLEGGNERLNRYRNESMNRAPGIAGSNVTLYLCGHS